MFQIGDLVRSRDVIGVTRFEGTVVAVNGRWIHVKHNRGEKSGAVSKVAPRFDYQADELEHINPLLRFAEDL